MELLSRYSNRPELLNPLVSALRAIQTDAKRGQEVRSVASPVPRRQDIRERIGEQGLAEMAKMYLAGSTAKDLATKHGICVKTVRRLMKERGARKR